MTLTVVIGSSGSGKTTFLNDCYEQHKCIYIRQYHTMRPYIRVSSIPHFDPTQLPYWDIYQREGTADTIPVGGTMAGEYTAGLSGGQRKMLLFELVRQRVAKQTDLLIALDEPFAGVTDDFVPFIVERLEEMRQTHNVVLVTNDHVQVLKDMADNILTVSAMDRDLVRINDHAAVDRRQALLALSVGDRMAFTTQWTDLQFFWNVEVRSNTSLVGLAGFVIFLFSMMLLTFWNSDLSSASLIIIAGEILTYFSLNPYLLSAVDWRNFMKQEAEALLHASIGMNMFLRTCLTLLFGFLIWQIEFGIINAVVKDNDGTLNTVDVWLGLFFDNLSSTLPLIFMGVFTNATQQEVEIIGSFPFLLMLFLSTAYSPGAGVPVLKELRYLFPKFYFWCYVPDVQDEMEGCPDTRAGILTYMALSSFFFTVLFIAIQFISNQKEQKKMMLRDKSTFVELVDESMEILQGELYGVEKGRMYFERLCKRAETMGRSSSHVSESSKEQ